MVMLVINLYDGCVGVPDGLLLLSVISTCLVVVLRSLMVLIVCSISSAISTCKMVVLRSLIVLIVCSISSVISTWLC